MEAHSDTPESLEIRDAGYGDPYLNLALEEDLFRRCPDHTIRLLFYRNAPAVIFGRNQNPWIECDMDACLSRHVALVRRISGGGTVFHDRGNLNYSFSMPRSYYDPRRFVGIVVQALECLGVPASACARHSVWIGGQKVSGTAFMLTGQRALLHGCILVNSDIALLHQVLRSPGRLLHTHGVPSVRAEVTCLADAHPQVTPERLAEAISQATATVLQPRVRRALPPESAHHATVAEYHARQISTAWILGRTATFSHTLSLGEGRGCRLDVEHGIVKSLETYGLERWNAASETALVGRDYDGSVLADALQTTMAPGPDGCALLTALRREIPNLEALRLKQGEPALSLSRPAVGGVLGQE